MVRTDFVSNSSSSSFILTKKFFKENNKKIPTRDSVVNAIRKNFNVDEWIHDNCYMSVVDMDEVRKNIKGKITYKKLCKECDDISGIEGFEDWISHNKMENVVVDPDCKFFIYMGDNDCWGMIDSRDDDMDRYNSIDNSCERIFELLCRTFGMNFDKKSVKLLHGNGHLG